MVNPLFKKPFWHPRVDGLALFLLILPTLAAMAVSAKADPDVYAALPEDTRVIQYGLGDLDGDSREELVVLFSSGERLHLSLFKARSGHWARWGDDTGSATGRDGAEARSVELFDTNGNGKDEILIYYLTPGNQAMATRVLAVETQETNPPSARVLLEELTSPPGYPLFGSTDGSPSVTFLKMPSENGSDGYRRAYCWEGDRFEKCLEIPWQKP